MYLQNNCRMRIQPVTAGGLLSCSVSPFINQHLCTTLCIPTHMSDSALMHFSVYWRCKQILKRISAETNMWTGIQSVVHKCWLLHGDIRWLDHFTNWYNIMYEKSEKGKASNSKTTSESVRSVWVGSEKGYSYEDSWAVLWHDSLHNV